MSDTPTLKDRFVNKSGGFLGVVIRAPGTATGFKGVALYPGQEIDLDEEEQAMTANAPRDPRANPLANGQLIVIAEGMDFKGRRPLRPDANLAVADPNNPATWSEEQRAHVAAFPEEERMRAQMETGMEVDPGAQPAVGEYSLHEETGLGSSEQPPVVPGATVTGAVETPSGGEPSPEHPADELQPTSPADAHSVILGPAERVGHQPAPKPVAGGSLQGR